MTLKRECVKVEGNGEKGSESGHVEKSGQYKRNRYRKGKMILERKMSKRENCHEMGEEKWRVVRVDTSGGN